MTNWIHLTEPGDQPVYLNTAHIASIATSTDDADGAATQITLVGGAVYDIVETVADVMARIGETSPLGVTAPIRVGAEAELAGLPDGIGAGSEQPTLLIYGMSDDLVEVEGLVGEAFNLEGDSEVTLLIAAPDDGPFINVRARFTTGWSLSVLHTIGGQWPYPIRATSRPDRPEDPALLLEVPPGTTVTHLERI